MTPGMRTAAVAALALSLPFGAMAQGQQGPESPPAATAPSPQAPPHHLDKCPDNLADFENSDATRKLVQKCLGQPSRVMPGRGSDVIWFYSAKGGITLVMVFDKAGALTHFRAYAQE